MADMKTKKCIKCGQERRLMAFAAQGSKTGALRNVCKACYRIERRGITGQGTTDYIRAQRKKRLSEYSMTAWGVILDRSCLIGATQLQEDAHEMRDRYLANASKHSRPFVSVEIKQIKAYVVDTP